MNINESIRNEKTKRRKIKGCAYNITFMSVVTYSRLTSLIPNERPNIKYFYPMVQYTNNLTYICITINDIMRNKRKMLETLRGSTYNIVYMSAANYSRILNLVPNQS